MSVSDLLSPNAQAILLLTSLFSNGGKGEIKPLTNTEWGSLAQWLQKENKSPSDFLQHNPKILLDGWQDLSKVGVDRIVKLLNRGHSLAFAMEKWQRAGLWVVTRANPEYPRRLKDHFGWNSPSVLFGCGDKALLNDGGLAIVGSRNAGESDLMFANQIASKAAEEGINIVSGGARGIDETAMLGGIRQGGSVIGVLADSLLRNATSTKWRSGLVEGQVVLVSPFYPEAGFSVGNAMARNKYIYCLSDASLVVHSGMSGGTFSGAVENLRKSWVPLWVNPTIDKTAGNAELVNQGGRWLPADVSSWKISILFEEPNKANAVQSQAGLELFPETDSEVSIESTSLPRQEELEPEKFDGDIEPNVSLAEESPVDFYNSFRKELYRIAIGIVSFEELRESMHLHKSQLDIWLERALNDEVIEKQKKRGRYYQIKIDLFNQKSSQESIFDAIDNNKVAEEISDFNVPSIRMDAVEIAQSMPVDFYQLFEMEFQRLAQKPILLDNLCESTQLHKSQLKEWLSIAVSRGEAKKLERPVRYQVVDK